MFLCLKPNSTTSVFDEAIVAIVFVALYHLLKLNFLVAFLLTLSEVEDGQMHFSFSLRFISALRFFVRQGCRDAAFSATLIFLLQ